MPVQNLQMHVKFWNCYILIILCFETVMFWNCCVLKLLCFETVVFCDIFRSVTFIIWNSCIMKLLREVMQRFIMLRFVATSYIKKIYCLLIFTCYGIKKTAKCLHRNKSSLGHGFISRVICQDPEQIKCCRSFRIRICVRRSTLCLQIEKCT